MSQNGRLPGCRTCGSLERHRGYRSALLRLDREILQRSRALQFSSDRTVERSWFRTFELSEYGGSNSLDIQSIARDSEAYDLVICSHVLEHVPDDVAALRELVRITSKHGFVFLAVPDPINRLATADWGFPDERQHGHYRLYGRDIQERFRNAIPECPVIPHRTRDPVTKIEDLVYFIFKSPKAAAAVTGRLDRPDN
jgi:SAM-dependent methyltransferase